MGYTTDFDGFFILDRPLTHEQREYLTAFAETRRMKRDVKIAESLPDPRRIITGLPIGPECAYFVGGSGPAGQDRDTSIINFNVPPIGQPGLWCQWVPSEDGTHIQWDGGEKFYSYVDWLHYLLNHFLVPWGYVLNGDVAFQGEDDNDRGVIMVRNNKVIVETF